MVKKKYNYVLVYDDTDEIVLNTNDPDEMIDCLERLIDEISGVSFHKIEITKNGKIVKSLDNMVINEEILKRLRKESKDGKRERN